MARPGNTYRCARRNLARQLKRFVVTGHGGIVSSYMDPPPRAFDGKAAKPSPKRRLRQ